MSKFPGKTGSEAMEKLVTFPGKYFRNTYLCALLLEQFTAKLCRED